MRFSYALLGIALLNGCQITGQKDATKSSNPNKIHQSAFFVNHSNKTLSSPQKQDDVWDRIAMQLSFPVAEDPRIDHYRKWYIKHPRHLQIVSQRAQPFLHLITEKVEERKIPLEIALLPIVESSFDQFSSSHMHAAGLWQFVPDTARRFGLEQNWWYDGRRDVVESTDAALDLLEYLHKKFDGNWLHALAAYNTGEGRVFRAIRLNEKKGKPTDFWALDLPKETSSYVPKLIAVADVLRNRDKYGIEFQPIANTPAVKLIKPNVPMDLEQAAQFAKISLKDLHKLNPAYHRLSTTPTGIHHLLLPVENVAQFNINMAKQNNLDHLVHKVKSGDALLKIASTYKTTVAAIQKANKLNGSNIRIGQKLIIPTISVHKEEQSTTANLNEQIESITLAKANFRQVEAPEQIQVGPKNLKKIDYTVTKGDSLWSIAKAHQISHTDLANWNNMDILSPIQIGKTLTIFTLESIKTDLELSAETVLPEVQLISSDTRKGLSNETLLPEVQLISDTELSASTGQPLIYQIKPGDSLSTIAQHYKVSVQELAAWNHLEKSSLITPGQELMLYINANQA